MLLLVSFYTEPNDAGMPAGWPQECKQVEDDFPLDQVPADCQLLSVDELDKLKEPLQPAANVALDAKRAAVAEALKVEMQQSALVQEDSIAQATVEEKKVYADLKISLSDGRTGQLFVDSSGLVHFEDSVP